MNTWKSTRETILKCMVRTYANINPHVYSSFDINTSVNAKVLVLDGDNKTLFG